MTKRVNGVVVVALTAIAIVFVFRELLPALLDGTDVGMTWLVGTLIAGALLVALIPGLRPNRSKLPRARWFTERK